MKSFYKFTVKSPAASYIPLPRFLLQDEQLRDISNDAKVLYALLLERASISRRKRCRGSRPDKPEASESSPASAATTTMETAFCWTMAIPVSVRRQYPTV